MDKIKNFWKKNDQKVLIILAIFLVAIVSFRAGETYKEKEEAAEIKISLNNSQMASNPKEQEIKVLSEALGRTPLAENSGEILTDDQITSNSQAQGNECAFVGSKNSDKYHLPDCRYVKNIKQENVVCFSSKEDAESQGYKPAGCCVK